MENRLFFGKTKLMARALGLTPETSTAPGLSDLSSAYLSGAVGLLFTNRPADEVTAYFASLAQQDFARAGQTATSDFVIPRGPVYSTGGRVPAADDVPMPKDLEPELRRLGVPTRLVKGRVVLGDGGGGGDAEEKEQSGGEGGGAQDDEGYRICREGDVLDSRQTRLLKLFDVCMSEFRVRVVAYWSAASEKVTEVEGRREPREGAVADKMDVEGQDEDEDE